MWGELALQLGGVELYREDREANDQARSVPQGLFAEILRQAAPCLILLDEVADYCVGASAVEVGDTTLADQTISFIQELQRCCNSRSRAWRSSPPCRPATWKSPVPSGGRKSSIAWSGASGA